MARQLLSIDDDVFEALQRLAEPLVDDVNSVLRRLLNLETESRSDEAEVDAAPDTSAIQVEAPRPGARRAGPTTQKRSPIRSATKKRPSTKPRAARGTLLPETEYEIPLLRSLENHGGSAPASEVIEEVGRYLDSKLTGADREVLKSGLTRWKNRVQFVRLNLVQSGHMKKDSPRGIWEISPLGQDRLNGNDDNE